MRVAIGLIVGLLIGVAASEIRTAAIKADARREATYLREQCDNWRELAVLRDEELQAAYQELGK